MRGQANEELELVVFAQSDARVLDLCDQLGVHPESKITFQPRDFAHV